MKFVDSGNTKVFMAVLLALLLGAASAAEAGRTYSIQSGSWTQKSGPTVLPVFPPATVMGTAMGTGSSPATLTIPSNVVVHSQFNFKIPLATFPYVQFTTNFRVNGPTAPAVLAPGTRPSRPANFAFCPGAAANPVCTTVAVGAGQGTKTGIVKYTAATPQFGGTMRMALGGSASFSTIVGSEPLQIAHFGGASPIPGETDPLIIGAPYAFNTVNPPPSVGAPVTTGALFSANGLITVPGNVVTTIMGNGSSSTGFPFTVGKVYVKATGTGGTTTVSNTGSDNRTAFGHGTITLVGGGLLQFQLNTRVILQTVSFTLGPPAFVPSIGRIGLAAMSTLLVVGGAVGLRRRSLLRH